MNACSRAGCGTKPAGQWRIFAAVAVDVIAVILPEEMAGSGLVLWRVDIKLYQSPCEGFSLHITILKPPLCRKAAVPVCLCAA